MRNKKIEALCPQFLVQCIIFQFFLSVLTSGGSLCFAKEAAGFVFQINGMEIVNVWEDDTDCAHVFLPSFADDRKTVVLNAQDAAASIGGILLSSGMDCSGFVPEREYDLVSTEYPSQKIIFHQSGSVASLFVTLDTDELGHVNSDKEYEAKADIALYEADGTLVCSHSSGCRISGRGNSTWLKNKKPYNLKLEQPESLLGMGAAKKWSLLANAFDESNLRNKVILDFARSIQNYQGFAPECAFVDFYLNGNYQGLYLMCQSMKDTASAFLKEAGEDGYEIELTMRGKLDEEAESVSLNPAMASEIKVPSHCTVEQKEQLNDMMAAVTEWINSDESSLPGIQPDIESWARKMLIEIVFENYDSPNASQYFWGSLQDGTIFAGPCWDYDLSMGIYYINWSTPHAIMAFKDWNQGEDISWYHGAWQKGEIQKRVLALYQQEYHEALSDLAETRILAEADMIAAAARMDRIRWPEYRQQYDSFEQAVSELIEFMRERILFLDALWIDREAYYVVTMRLPNTRMLHCYVPAGEKCEELPKPWEVSLAGEGMEGVTDWYREDNDELFDPNTKITEDLTLYAKLPDEEKLP